MCGKCNKIYAIYTFVHNIPATLKQNHYVNKKKKRYLVDKTQWRYIHIVLQNSFLSSYTDCSSQPDFGKGNYSTMMVSDLVTSLMFINVLTMVTWQLH